MPEQPTRHSALAGTGQPVGSGNGRADVTLSERRGLALVHLGLRSGGNAVLDDVRRALGISPPSAPNTAAAGERLTIFWLAPGRWLIESHVIAAIEIERRLRDDLADHAAVVDVSSGRAVIRVAGRDARRLLARGCPIDLDARALPPGAVARTMLEDIAVMLHVLPDAEGLDLYVARSYARHAWEWLAQAAADLE